ncbi:MAG: hypothetical protein KDN19_04930 [Verrucomicrobiae bacterium]|nr:hypothetical protein [Verrucomicrobiae bacterium]
MKRLLRLLAFSGLTFAAMTVVFTSCGTVGGLGEDISRLGRKIERKTDDDGVARGFGEDLQRLGGSMERKSDEVYYGDTY